MKDTYEILFNILNSIDAIVYVSDMKTYELMFVNNHVKDLFGDIVGQPCWKSLQTGQSGPCVFCTNDKLLDPAGNPKGVYHWEFQNTINGRWYDIRDRAMKLTDGRVVRLEIATDITERKRTEEELNASKEKIQALLDALPDMIFILDRKGVFLDYHAPKRQVLYAPPESFLGKNIRDVMPPQIVESFLPILDKTNKSVESQLFEYALDMPDGQHHYEAHIVSYHGDNILAVIRDITVRKKAVEDLLKSEKLLAESQRIAHIGSWEHNLTTGEVVWSDELFNILGLDPLNDPADFKTFFNMIHPEDRPALKKAIDETVQTGKHFSIDYRFLLPDGRTRILHAQAELIRDSAGSNVILSGTGQDITERKLTEEERDKTIFQLKDALAKVRQLSRMLPICASCKKIRDDKGYWNQLEVYISEHTDTIFSHGLCPECAKKSYEELYKLKNRRDLKHSDE